MTFLVADLLLTDAKSAELEAALATTGISDPLEHCIEEAIAEVDRMTTGYRVDDASRKSWIRAIALLTAYTLVGELPEEIKAAAEVARQELRDISSGKRPNLQKIDTDDEDVDAGAWGSETKI